MYRVSECPGIIRIALSRPCANETHLKFSLGSPRSHRDLLFYCAQRSRKPLSHSNPLTISGFRPYLLVWLSRKPYATRDLFNASSRSAKSSVALIAFTEPFRPTFDPCSPPPAFWDGSKIVHLTQVIVDDLRVQSWASQAAKSEDTATSKTTFHPKSIQNMSYLMFLTCS